MGLSAICQGCFSEWYLIKLPCSLQKYPRGSSSPCHLFLLSINQPSQDNVWSKYLSVNIDHDDWVYIAIKSHLYSLIQLITPDGSTDFHWIVPNGRIQQKPQKLCIHSFLLFWPRHSVHASSRDKQKKQTTLEFGWVSGSLTQFRNTSNPNLQNAKSLKTGSSDIPPLL